MKRYIPIIIAGGLLLAHAAHAAVLTVAPPDVKGNAVIVLDTQGQSVNAVELHLTFNPSLFSISEINDGGSVVSLWITPSVFSNEKGTVDLAGVIPGGIVTKHGIIATLLITPKMGNATGSFTIASASALLNDGKGTPAALSMVSAPFPLVPIMKTTSSAPVDTQAPDPFIPQISSDPVLFGGAYFVAFSATDQRSGIDHYEVLEVPAGTGSGALSGWAVATSPYLLKDQTLSSDIYIRAVDHAGNFRVVKISAVEAQQSVAPATWKRALPWLFGIIIVLLIGIVLTWRKKKHT